MKIKQHPIDKNIFMYFDIATNQLSMFFINKGWNWNNDFNKPTVFPSIKNTDNNGFVNHVFITDGKIHYLDDCTHKLKGTVVDMVDFPKNW